jgi:hypothetical protein
MGWRRRFLELATTTGFVLSCLASVGLVLWTNPALAKGPRRAFVSSPGLPHPVVIRGDEAAFLFFMGRPGGHALLPHRPTGALGPRVKVTYPAVWGPHSGTVIEYAFPYARPRPVTYVPPSQRAVPLLPGYTWEAAHTAFTSTFLQAVGLPTSRSARVPLPTPRTTPTGSSFPRLPVGFVAALALMTRRHVLGRQTACLVPRRPDERREWRLPSMATGVGEQGGKLFHGRVNLVFGGFPAGLFASEAPLDLVRLVLAATDRGTHCSLLDHLRYRPHPTDLTIRLFGHGARRPRRRAGSVRRAREGVTSATRSPGARAASRRGAPGCTGPARRHSRPQEPTVTGVKARKLPRRRRRSEFQGRAGTGIRAESPRRCFGL